MICVCVCVCVCIVLGCDVMHSSKARMFLLLLFFRSFKAPVMNLFVLIFWPCCAACEILVPLPWTKPVPPAVEAWSLSQWPTRGVPTGQFFM